MTDYEKLLFFKKRIQGNYFGLLKDKHFRQKMQFDLFWSLSNSFGTIADGETVLFYRICKEYYSIELFYQH